MGQLFKEHQVALGAAATADFKALLNEACSFLCEGAAPVNPVNRSLQQAHTPIRMHSISTVKQAGPLQQAAESPACLPPVNS